MWKILNPSEQGSRWLQDIPQYLSYKFTSMTEDVHGANNYFRQGVYGSEGYSVEK